MVYCFTGEDIEPKEPVDADFDPNDYENDDGYEQAYQEAYSD